MHLIDRNGVFGEDVVIGIHRPLNHCIIDYHPHHTHTYRDSVKRVQVMPSVVLKNIIVIIISFPHNRNHAYPLHSVDHPHPKEPHLMKFEIKHDNFNWGKAFQKSVCKLTSISSKPKCVEHTGRWLMSHISRMYHAMHINITKPIGSNSCSHQIKGLWTLPKSQWATTGRNCNTVMPATIHHPIRVRQERGAT